MSVAPLASETARPLVALVHTGRSSTGGDVRLGNWRRIIDRSGAQRLDVALTREHGASAASVLRGAWPVLSGRAAPESLAWSAASATRVLTSSRPLACIFVTSRAFAPGLAQCGRVSVLDFVDRLSASYRHRSVIEAGHGRSAGYRALALAHRRLERDALATRRVTAGFSEAAEMGMEWLPMLLPDVAPADVATGPDHDVLFVGNLTYGPNVAALRRLRTIWPHVMEKRPVASLLVAGRAPSPEVRELCAANSWTLVADFQSTAAMFARGRCAIAPIDHATGMQTKVLDAAASRVPQVMTSAVHRGLHPAFPAVVADTDRDFASGVLGLLDDPGSGAQLARRAYEHSSAWYGVDRWAGWLRSLLTSAGSHPQ